MSAYGVKMLVNGLGQWHRLDRENQKCSWPGVTMSSDGTKIVALQKGHKIMLSSDSCETWQEDTRIRSNNVLEGDSCVSGWHQDCGEDTSIAHKNGDRFQCQMMAPQLLSPQWCGEIEE
eukprot:s262_g8.t1